MKEKLIKRLSIWLLILCLLVAQFFFRSTLHAEEQWASEDQKFIAKPTRLNLNLCLANSVTPSDGAQYKFSDSLPIFHAENGECAIDFPSKPSLVKQALRVSEGEKLLYDIYLSSVEGTAVFMLLIATYPVPLSDGHEVAGLEGLLKGILEHHPENRLIFADLVQSFHHPAIDFLVKSSTSYFRGHAVMVGNKLYLVAMEGLTKEVDESSFVRFFSSFKLL
jgi:hypothetical protein